MQVFRKRSNKGPRRIKAIGSFLCFGNQREGVKNQPVGIGNQREGIGNQREGIGNQREGVKNQREGVKTENMAKKPETTNGTQRKPAKSRTNSKVTQYRQPDGMGGLLPANVRTVAEASGLPAWLAVSSIPTERIKANAQDMVLAACQYFKWCDDNPITIYEAIKSGVNCGKLVSIPKQRVYTWQGVCHFMGMSYSQFKAYRLELNRKTEKTDSDKALQAAISFIEETIFRQKFEGAASDIFNSSLIARDLGLHDNTNITVTPNDANAPAAALVVKVYNTGEGIAESEDEIK